MPSGHLEDALSEKMGFEQEEEGHVSEGGASLGFLRISTRNIDDWY